MRFSTAELEVFEPMFGLGAAAEKARAVPSVRSPPNRRD